MRHKLLLIIGLLCAFSAPSGDMRSAPRAGSTTSPAAQAQDKVPWGAKDFGVLILSHGGSSRWNELVLDVQKALASKYPVEAAFGMADPTTIQYAVDHLEAQHVKKIIAVPLFISSHSEVFEETKYVLRIRKDPSADFIHAPHSHMMHMEVRRLKSKIPIVLTAALDDDPIVADILLDRAKEMSRNPQAESLILVGHGPLKDEENALWLRDMDHLAMLIQKKEHFASVHTATLRDDAPDAVRKKAEEELRGLVKTLSPKGKVIIVPYLIAQGGIERHIPAALDGLFYGWTGKTLLPDPRIIRWVDERVTQAAPLPDMRKFK